MKHLLGAESWRAFADTHKDGKELKERLGYVGRLRLRLRLRLRTRPGKQLSPGLALQMQGVPGAGGGEELKKESRCFFWRNSRMKFLRRGNYHYSYL